MSDQKELQKLIEEFDAARSVETEAIRTIDAAPAGDLNVLVKATRDMLQAHNKSMEVYFKLLKHKLNPQKPRK